LETGLRHLLTTDMNKDSIARIGGQSHFDCIPSLLPQSQHHTERIPQGAWFLQWEGRTRGRDLASVTFQDASQRPSPV
jgi:hypothetical protein